MFKHTFLAPNVALFLWKKKQQLRNVILIQQMCLPCLSRNLCSELPIFHTVCGDVRLLSQSSQALINMMKVNIFGMVRQIEEEMDGVVGGGGAGCEARRLFYDWKTARDIYVKSLNYNKQIVQIRNISQSWCAF